MYVMIPSLFFSESGFSNFKGGQVVKLILKKQYSKVKTAHEHLTETFLPFLHLLTCSSSPSPPNQKDKQARKKKTKKKHRTTRTRDPSLSGTK